MQIVRGKIMILQYCCYPLAICRCATISIEGFYSPPVWVRTRITFIPFIDGQSLYPEFPEVGETIESYLLRRFYFLYRCHTTTTFQKTKGRYFLLSFVLGDVDLQFSVKRNAYLSSTISDLKKCRLKATESIPIKLELSGTIKDMLPAEYKHRKTMMQHSSV